MGVQLNIKDRETVRLARELAGATKRSVTETIRRALERAAAERNAEIAAKIASIREIAADFRANIPAEWEGKTSKEIMDAIYEEDGSLAS